MEFILAAKSDFVQINTIAKEIHGQHIGYDPKFFKSVEFPISKEYFYELISSNQISVCKINNKIVSYMIYKMFERKYPGVFDRKIFLIEQLAVKAEFQKRGIGMKFMEFAIDKAKAEKCTDIDLTVHPENKNALDFYEKLGMKIQNIKYNIKI